MPHPEGGQQTAAVTVFDQLINVLQPASDVKESSCSPVMLIDLRCMSCSLCSAWPQ